MEKGEGARRCNPRIVSALSVTDNRGGHEQERGDCAIRGDEHHVPHSFTGKNQRGISLFASLFSTERLLF